MGATRAARRSRSFGVVALSRHAHGAAGGRHPESFAPLSHFAEALHQHGFSTGVFVVIDVAELEEHLQLHEVLLDGRVIDELLFDDALDLA